MPEKIKTAIQEAIRESGLTLEQLAAESGVSPAQVSRFLRNERTLTLPAVERLCEVLGLSLTASRKSKRKGK